MKKIKTRKYPKKKVIINRINAYIERFEDERNDNIDTLFILKQLIKD